MLWLCSSFNILEGLCTSLGKIKLHLGSLYGEGLGVGSIEGNETSGEVLPGHDSFEKGGLPEENLWRPRPFKSSGEPSRYISETKACFTGFVNKIDLFFYVYIFLFSGNICKIRGIKRKYIG